jgi:hypothetical protein
MIDDCLTSDRLRREPKKRFALTFSHKQDNTREADMRSGHEVKLPVCCLIVQIMSFNRNPET